MIKLQNTLMLLAPLVFIGCGTASKAPTADKKLNSAIEQIYSDEFPPSYSEAWDLYLKSSHISETGPKNASYEQTDALINAGKISCREANWEVITRSNFWSLKPHISAASCYEQNGEISLASRHNNAISYLLKGILNSGDGETYYSAYEVGTLGDAHDIVELMGLEIVDFYGDFFSSRKAFYYVIVANDPKTGKQKEIYFDNQRFVHAVMGVQFPFLGLIDGWKERVLPSIASQGRSIKVPLAAAEAADGNFDRAFQLYMEAIADGSLRARYRLAMLGIEKKIEAVSPQQSVQLLIEAAEKKYVPAIVVLSYLYERGIAVERDLEVARQLTASAEQMREPGYVYYLLASHFANGLLSAPDKDAARRYYQLAENAGNIDAKLVLAFEKMADESYDKGKMLTELIAIAEGGSKWAHYVTAELIRFSYEKDSKEYSSAHDWLVKAADFQIPEANYRLGMAYMNGGFGVTDTSEALNRLTRAALKLHPEAMLELGFFIDTKMGAFSDRSLAARWYFMCSAAGNATCATNLGYFYENGDGVKKDLAFALKLYESAVKQNHPRAYNSIGLLYWKGRGVQKNIGKAIENFEKAAELGHYYGDFNLGVIYMDGIDVPRDLIRAKGHFQKASKHKGAAAKLAQLEQMMKTGAP